VGHETNMKEGEMRIKLWSKIPKEKNFLRRKDTAKRMLKKQDMMKRAEFKCFVIRAISALL
jgi:hypothetical protein